MNDNNPNTDPGSWAAEQPTQYQAQPQPQQQYQQMPPQPMYQPAPAPVYGYPMAAPQEKSGISGAMIGLIAFLVFVLVAVGGAVLYVTMKDSDTVAIAGGQTSTVVRTEVQQAPSGGGASSGGSSGLAGGNLSSAWPGTSVTSGPFTEAVRRAYVDYRNSTGAESGTISAYSTVTHRSYSMWCRPSGSNIKCTGGNNAVVYIG